MHKNVLIRDLITTLKNTNMKILFISRGRNPLIRVLFFVFLLFPFTVTVITAEDKIEKSGLESIETSIEALLPSKEKDDLKSRYYLLLAREKLNQKKYNETLDILESKSEYILDEKMSALLKGIAYYLTESYYEAEAELLNITLEDKENKDALYLLGKIYYERGELNIAIETWEKALSLESDNIELEEMIAKAKREAAVEEKMDKTYTGRFLINYNGKRDEAIGNAVAGMLEEAYYDVGIDLNFFPDKDITVIIYTEKEFKNVTLAPGWAGGLYDGKIRIPSGGIELSSVKLKRLIYHEFTHAVIHSLTGNLCPKWLHEGLAMYEESKINGEGETFNLEGNKKVQISNVDDINHLFSSGNASEALFAYERSFTFTKNLIDNYGIHKISSLLHELKGNQSFKESFNQVYSDYNLSFDKWWEKVYKD